MKIKKIYVHPLFLLLITASLFLNFFKYLIWIYLITFIHEMAHILVARLLNVHVKLIKLMPFGIELRLKNEHKISSFHMAVIAVAGPISNLIMAILTVFFHQYLPKDIYNFLLIANILLFITNILPTIPLDGGKILKALLLIKYNEIGAYKRTLFISKITVLFLIGLSIFAFFIMQYNFSLLIIATFIAFYIFDENKDWKLMQKKLIFNYKEKLKDTKNQTLSVNIISAKPSILLRKLIRKFNLEKLNLIYVVDDDLRIIKKLTEGEIIDAVIDYGACTKLSQILKQ